MFDDSDPSLHCGSWRFLQIPISDVVVETVVMNEMVKFWLANTFVHEKTLFVSGSVFAQ